MPQGPIAVETFRLPSTWIDSSGTISTANASQIALSGNTARKAFFVMNPVTSVSNLYVNFTSAASTSTSGTNGSISLAPGGTYTDPPGFVTTETINVASGTAGQQYIIKFR